jgi:Spy/CpxP family protein refolding chaperone
MIMRKLMLAAIAVVFVCSTALGQQRQRPSSDDIAKKQTEQMTKNLSLTDDQKAKVDAINLKYAKKQEEAFKSSKEDREAKREEMKKTRDAKDSELKAVLTADQYTKYQQIREEQKNKRGEKGKGKGSRSGNAS